MNDAFRAGISASVDEKSATLCAMQVPWSSDNFERPQEILPVERLQV